MNKETILLNIEEKLKNKLQSNSNDLNLKLIAKIFETENWYLNIELDTFVNILLDLDFTKEDSLKLYIELISQ